MKTINPKIYLALVTCSVLFFSACYYICFDYQLGAAVEAEWWLKDVYSYKDYVAQQTPSPKIIIMSGSNGLFGVDSGVISRRTGYPAVNLAGHAAMDLDFFYVKLRDHIGDGDIVVMPLEFAFLQRDRMTDWFVNNMLAWGEEDYLSKLDATGLAKLLVSVPKARLYTGMLRQNGTNPMTLETDIVENLERIFQEEGIAWRGYEYRSLNRYGDIVSGPEMTDEFKKQVAEGFFYYGGWDISDRFFGMFDKINQLVEEHQGKVVLTWSVSMKNKNFDLSRKQFQNNIEKIRANLAQKFVSIECDPADFHFDQRRFFDTFYHLNAGGALERSTRLADCIMQVINEQPALKSDVSPQN